MCAATYILIFSLYKSVTVYYPSCDKIMQNVSAFYCVCLPVGHNMNVHYLSGTHFCQNVALRYFLCFFCDILSLHLEVPFEIRLSALNPVRSVSHCSSLCHDDGVNCVGNVYASCFLAAPGPHLCTWKILLKGMTQNKRQHIKQYKQKDKKTRKVWWKTKTDEHSAPKNAALMYFLLLKKPQNSRLLACS